MPEFLSLEEAARTLGLSPDELRQLAQDRKIRAFMDAGSWRFRKPDIEEEARRRGMGSDPELSLSDLDLVAQQGDSGTGDDLDLSEYQLGVASAQDAHPSIELPADDRDDDLLLDDRSVPHTPGGSSSTIIGLHPGKGGKRPSDSDVRLVPDNTKGISDSDIRIGGLKGASDSDVRIGGPGRRPSDSDVTLMGDDASMEIDEVAPIDDPNATMLQPSPNFGSSEDDIVAADESGSDFELTPSSVIDALEPESGSDFELTALDASSDEFETTPLRSPGDSDVTGIEPSSSGVNLGRPSDSGINLQAVGSFDLGQADSIELAPLDEDAAEDAARAASKPRPKPAPKPQKEEVDLSATALPIRQEKDIFEDTDFDVDVEAIDASSDDRTVQLDAQSDFDVEEGGDSASEVFAIDEEDVDANAATAMRPAPMDDDEGEGVSGETDSAWDIGEEASAPMPTPSGRTGGVSLVTSGGAGAEWGGLWVGFLAVSTVLMLLLSFVGFDLIRNLYGFQGDIPVASGLVKTIAGLVGGG